MKNNIKNIVTLLGIAFLAALSFYGWLNYETRFKVTYVGREDEPDGAAAVIFQMLGEAPADADALTGGRFIVKQGDREIKTVEFQVSTLGEPLSEKNWTVEFYPAGVEVTLVDASGEERQNDIVYYDGSDAFSGYSEQEVVPEIRRRYGAEISCLGREDGRYCFQADGFQFYVDNDFYMTDNYEEAYFAYLAEQFSHAHNRALIFEKGTGRNGKDVYIPVIDFFGRHTGESESFSNACCDLVEGLQGTVEFEQIGYFEEEDRHYFDLTPYLEDYSRTELYNALYVAIERDSLEVWQKKDAEQMQGGPEENADGGGAGNGGEESKQSAEESVSEFPEEMPEVWKNYDADCVYKKKDGTELRMVGVDRAAGSSYYALLKAENGEITSVVNWDPYLGLGGGAKWLDFLEDEKIGFSCLSYSGGSKGCLYRTSDGGVSFEEITWPSGEKKLPDGSLYNPFIMPEKVWEENEKLYMLVSQGPEGDYYEDGVWVYGLYESEDMGKNWTYVGTQEGEDIRPLW